jgi:hypothetical protein
MFHHRDEENAKLNAELDRISALPLPQLAAEVMAKGFGPGGPGEKGPTGIGTVAGVFNPAQISVGIDNEALIVMYRVVAEAVQMLEHAVLVRCDVSGSGGVYGMAWSSTRAGDQALSENGVERALGVTAVQ